MNTILQQLLQNNYDITKLDYTLEALVNELSENPETLSEIQSFEPLIGEFIKWKLYGKAFKDDFNSIKLILEKIIKPNTHQEGSGTVARIPIPGSEGEFEERIIQKD